MVAAEGEAEVMGARVAELTTSLNNILGSFQGMEKWIPCIDSGIRELNKTVEGIAARVTALETPPPTALSPTTPTPIGPRVDEYYQGVATGVLAAQERTLVKVL